MATKTAALIMKVPYIVPTGRAPKKKARRAKLRFLRPRRARTLEIGWLSSRCTARKTRSLRRMRCGGTHASWAEAGCGGTMAYCSTASKLFRGRNGHTTFCRACGSTHARGLLLLRVVRAGTFALGLGLPCPHLPPLPQLKLGSALLCYSPAASTCRVVCLPKWESVWWSVGFEDTSPLRLPLLPVPSFPVPPSCRLLHHHTLH